MLTKSYRLLDTSDILRGDLERLTSYFIKTWKMHAGIHYFYIFTVWLAGYTYEGIGPDKIDNNNGDAMAVTETWEEINFFKD